MTPQDDPATGTPDAGTGTDPASTGTLSGGSEASGTGGSTAQDGGSGVESLEELRQRLIQTEQALHQKSRTVEQLLSEKSAVEEQRRRLAEQNRGYPPPTSGPDPANEIAEEIALIDQLSTAEDKTAKTLGRLIKRLATGQALSQQELDHRARLAALEPEIQAEVDALVRGNKASFDFAVEHARSKRSQAKGTDERAKAAERQAEAQAKRDSAPGTGLASVASASGRKSMKIADYDSKMNALPRDQARALMSDVDNGVIELIP